VAGKGQTVTGSIANSLNSVKWNRSSQATFYRWVRANPSSLYCGMSVPHKARTADRADRSYRGRGMERTDEGRSLWLCRLVPKHRSRTVFHPLLATCGAMLVASCVPPYLGWSSPDYQPQYYDHHPTVSHKKRHKNETTVANTPANKTDPAGEPSDMIGLNQDQLIAALGQPQSKRDDPPGKAWRYQIGSCSVDFFFYPDVRTRQYRILHTEVKGHDTNQRNSGCRTSAASSANR
jgi:hypothetical protein